MLDDMRQALRNIAKQPGFTLVAILTLAFGIGVNTTIFSIVSALFLQPLRAKAPEQLVVVMQRGEIINVPYGYSYPDYLDYRKSVAAFEDLAAFMPTPVHVSTHGQAAERTWIEVVSPNYFDLAGVTMADHHTESERFLTHVAREEAAGRRCPADWSWIVPPMSGGLTPVYHRYYDEPEPGVTPTFLPPAAAS